MTTELPTEEPQGEQVRKIGPLPVLPLSEEHFSAWLDTQDPREFKVIRFELTNRTPKCFVSYHGEIRLGFTPSALEADSSERFEGEGNDPNIQEQENVDELAFDSPFVIRTILGFFYRYFNEKDRLNGLLAMGFNELFYYSLRTPIFLGEHRYNLFNRILRFFNGITSLKNAKNIGIVPDNDDMIGEESIEYPRYEKANATVKNQFRIITMLKAVLTGMRFTDVMLVKGERENSSLKAIISRFMSTPCYDILHKLGLVNETNRELFWRTAMRMLFDETLITVFRNRPEIVADFDPKDPKKFRANNAVVQDSAEPTSTPKSNPKNQSTSSKPLGDLINIEAWNLIPLFEDFFTQSNVPIIPPEAVPYLVDYIEDLFNVLYYGGEMHKDLALPEVLKLIRDTQSLLKHLVRIYGIKPEDLDFSLIYTLNNRLDKLHHSSNSKFYQFTFNKKD